MISLKQSGSISLADPQTGSLVKRALLCREGEFEGMTGPVSVSRELLESILNRYVDEKESAQNENDYAPILLDHDRLVNNVKGRLLSKDMELAPWLSPEGEELTGLYGTLRVDDPDAQIKVKSGQYAQLSISFDEETFELFEVSFVAVPAAKGSIILSKSNGGSMDTRKQLAQANRKVQSLAATALAARTTRKAQLARIQKSKVELSKEAKSLSEGFKTLTQTIKTAQLKARFFGFVREGKMLPVELKKLDMKELSQMSDKTIEVLFGSYSARPVSQDAFTYGQGGETEVVTDMSPAKMREAMKLQRAGKSLSEKDALPEDKAKAMSDEDKEGEDEKKHGEETFSMSAEDHKACMEHMNHVQEKLSACMEKMGQMGKAADEMADADKDEEKKMGEDDGGSDMSEDEDEEEKKKLAAEEDKEDDKSKGDK